MPKLIDLTGMQFTELTVLRRTNSKTYSNKPVVVWLCRCSCGKETEVASINLRSGNTKSCGTCSYSTERRWKKGRSWKWDHHLPPGRMTRNAVLKTYQHHAKARKLTWTLTEEAFDKLTSESCFYCGAPPVNKRQMKGDPAPFIYNGIDRTHNDKGYIDDNVVSCCRICNRAKSDLPYGDWLTYLIRVKTHAFMQS